MIVSRSRFLLGGLVAFAAFAATNASALPGPGPSGQPITALPKLKVSLAGGNASSNACGADLVRKISVVNEGNVKAEGYVQFRGVNTPFTVDNGNFKTVEAKGGVLDCLKDLAPASLEVRAGTPSVGKGLPLFNTTIQFDHVNYDANQKISVKSLSGYVAIALPVESSGFKFLQCGKVPDLKIMNKVFMNSTAIPMKLSVGYAGVVKLSTYPADSETPVVAGALDCKAGAPVISLSGDGFDMVKLEPKSVTFL